MHQQTALHFAAQNGHVDCCRLLLDRGADRSIKNVNGKTALEVTKSDAVRQLFSSWVPPSTLATFDPIVIRQQLIAGTATTTIKQFASCCGFTARAGIWRVATEIAVEEEAKNAAVPLEIVSQRALEHSASQMAKQQAEATVERLKHDLKEAEANLVTANRDEERARMTLEEVRSRQKKAEDAREHLQSERAVAEHELAKSMQVIADIDVIVQSGNLAKMKSDAMKEVLVDVGLKKYISSMEAQQVLSGDDLNGLSDSELQTFIGMKEIGDRKRLRSTLEMIRRCRTIRMANQSAGTATANGALPSPKAALWWTPEDVSRWLRENGVPAEACDVLRTLNVNGEILMFITKDELHDMAPNKLALGIVKKITRVAEQLTEQFFASNQRNAPPPTTAATAAAPAAQVVRLPQDFLCPITQDVMVDPVVLIGDGFAYERSAIAKWLQSGHNTSPMTGAILTTTELVTSHTLRSAIASFLDQHPEHRPSH